MIVRPIHMNVYYNGRLEALSRCETVEMSIRPCDSNQGTQSWSIIFLSPFRFPRRSFIFPFAFWIAASSIPAFASPSTKACRNPT